MARPVMQGTRDTGTTPLFSIITVVDADSDWLGRCLRSVRAQACRDWEHIVVLRNSDQSTAARAMDEARADPRVQVVGPNPAGTRAAALNQGCGEAAGRWLAFLEPEDQLAPGALAAMAGALRQNPDTVLAYSDWSEVDSKGSIVRSFLKPDWSPERLRGNQYVTDLTVMSRADVQRVGGFRDKYPRAEELDLLLRLTEDGARVLHVAEVLYHRQPRGSAESLDDYAAIAAVQEHCDRIGLHATVRGTGSSGYRRLDRVPRKEHSVSVVIPTRGTEAEVFGEHSVMVVDAVRSMIDSSPTWPFEVVVVADEPLDAPYLADLHQMLGPRLRVVPYRKPFNFSEKVDLGALHATGDIVVFANDDLRIISPRWLEELTALAEQDDVGLVGALLKFEDGSVQHCGHVYQRKVAFHAHFGVATETGYFGDTLIDHEASGATAALVACRREVWSQVGGFSVKFPGSFNDVDFCMKIRRFGYRIVVACAVQSWHFESKSRDPSVEQWEVDLMQARWGSRMLVERYLRGEGLLEES